MAWVEVRLFATLRREAGERDLRLRSTDLEEVLEELGSRYGPAFRLRLDEATFLINGENADLLEGKKTILRDGDVISVFPPLAGG